jgi:aryl-alcohol dehydrogenase-like predicted oxidoreductase
MRYRNLGRTGIKVSPYALGALMLATQVGNPDPEDSIRIIHRALDAGINLVDTADAYGDSEEVVGRALKGRRDNVVLATKVSRPVGTDPNQQGASRRWIMTAVENSLRRLQTDHIDVYQIHRPDPDTDIEETLSALTDLLRSGKIRAFGTSTMPASNLVEAHWVAERRGLERFRTEQPPYSILSRGIEREVLPVAQQYGMGVLAWGPLGQGMLTGRVRRGQASDVTRAKYFTVFSDERRLDAVERLIPLAEEAGLSMPHLAMAFAISHPGVTSALLGARTMEQLDDLIAGVDVVLSDDVLDRHRHPGPGLRPACGPAAGTAPAPAQRALRRLRPPEPARLPGDQVELVPFDVGEGRPARLARLQVPEPAGTQAQQALGLALEGVTDEVQVQAVLDHLRLRDLVKYDGWLAGVPRAGEHHGVLGSRPFCHLPPEDIGPEPGQDSRVGAVEGDRVQRVVHDGHHLCEWALGSDVRCQKSEAGGQMAVRPPSAAKTAPVT